MRIQPAPITEHRWPPQPYTTVQAGFHLRALQPAAEAQNWGKGGALLRASSKGIQQWRPAQQPQFKVGSWVSVQIDQSPEPRAFPDLSMKGWTGWVTEALTDGQSEVYCISLDGTTLSRLPKRYLRSIIEAFESFPFDFEFSPAALQACPATDSPDGAYTTQRKVFHTYFWGNIEQDAQAARMHAILTRDLTVPDLENWLYFFQQNVNFPFRAKVEGLCFGDIPAGTVVEVVGIEGIKQEECDLGLIATLRKGKAILSYPLKELLPEQEENASQQPLGDYRYWADFSLL